MGRVVLMACIAALLAPSVACAADDPPGFRRHNVLDAGMSVLTPIGWPTLARRDATWPGTREIMTRLDPSFTTLVNALGIPDSPLKLFAFDRRFRRGHPTTLLVVRATWGKPGAYNSWAPRMAKSLHGAPGRASGVDLAGVDLRSGLALHARYTTTSRDTVSIYFVASGDGIWTLVLRTPTARAARDERLMQRVARSLELRQPLGGASVRPPLPGS